MFGRRPPQQDQPAEKDPAATSPPRRSSTGSHAMGPADAAPGPTPGPAAGHEPSPAAGPAAGPTGSGKGRPTPSRRQSEVERLKRARPPADKKEERRRRREAVSAQRGRTREAMATGDDRFFVARDKGPVRRLVRDLVDSRRSAAEYFLPAIVLIFILSLIRTSPAVQRFASLLWLVVIVVVVIDLVTTGRRIGREVRRRFPHDPGKGHVFYGIMRATQLRRFRLPKPQVQPGTRV